MGLTMGSPAAAEIQNGFQLLEGDEKQRIQQSLAVLKFAEPEENVAKFRCHHCDSVLLSHYIANCRHHFCGSCYEKFCLRPCPIDQCPNDVIDQVTHDVEVEKGVYELKVHCENTKAGCEEIISLRDYLDHLKTCSFVGKLNGPGPAKDTHLQMADEVARLKRNVRELHEKLLKNEEMLKLSLYNERRLSAEIGLIEDRLNRQFRTVLFQDGGVSGKGQHDGPQKGEMSAGLHPPARAGSPKRESQLEQLKKMVTDHVTVEFTKNLTDQISDKIQIQLEEMKQEITDKYKKDIQQLTEPLTDLRNSCTQTSRAIEEMDSKFITSTKYLLEKNSTKFIWKLKGFRQLVRNFKTRQWKDLDSEICVTKEHGYRIRAKLVYEAGYFLLKLGFLDNDDDTGGVSTDDSELQKAGRPTIYYHRTTFLVLDQSDHWEKRDIVRVEEPSFGDCDARNMMKGYYGPAEFAALQLLQQDDTYVRDDTILFKIMVEPLSLLYKTVSVHDGTLLWRVDRYFKKKQDEIDGLLFCLKSDYFYTSAKGYRLQVLLCLNGYGQGFNGKYLSAYVHFVHGEWDDFLPDYFPHRTTFMILDQTDSVEKEHRIRTFRSTRTTTDSAHDFALQSEIENDMYLMDEALLIKVKVDP